MLKAGEVYSTDRLARRVLACIGGWVIYSTGGDKNGACRVASFRRWVKRQKANKQEDND